MNTLEKETKIGDLVKQDYRTAGIFKEHHIDFCCGGDKSIEQACDDKKTSVDKLLAELSKAISQKKEAQINYDQMPIDLLADYIEKTHHRYVEAQIPILRQYLKKLVAVHSEGAPYLREVEQLFITSSGNLAQHMKKEELVLFPFIRKMVEAKIRGEQLPSAHFGAIDNPITMMMEEHSIEGDHFKQMQSLTNDYSVPEWGCNTFMVAMKTLEEFQDDLFLHIHLENNILFPKAKAFFDAY